MKYNKPMAWNKFIGQERAIEILKVYLKEDRLPNALIFSGIRGIGKFSLAKELAKASNCKAGGWEACDGCRSCIQIERGIHPDFFTFFPQGAGEEITIELVRELGRFLSFSPQLGRRKFFLIDQAERMNEEASNAFLKSLEEPPGDAVIILITSRPRNLLATIYSRCQEVKFSPLKREQIQKLLVERYNLAPSEAKYLAGISQGSLGKALELKGKRLEDIFSRLNEFFFSSPFAQHPNLELREQRQLLKENIEMLILLLREALFVRLEMPEISILNLSREEPVLKFERLEEKVLVEKIEKLDYLYRTIDLNLNPELLYKVSKKIWEEVKS